MAKTRILIVEDESIQAESARLMLGLLGYEFSGWVTNGKDALDWLLNNKADLVLMDVEIAGNLDGIETAELIHQKHPVPVVFLSAYGDLSTVRRARLTEPYGYVVKPYERSELRCAIEIALYRHQMESQVRESEHRFRAMLESIDIVAVTLDLAGTVTFANQALVRISGWSQDEILGHNWFELFMPHVESVKTKFAQVIETGNISTYVETEIKTRLGENLLFAWHNTVLRGSAGKIEGLAGLGMDITKARQTEIELRSSEEKYRALVESSDESICLLDRSMVLHFINQSGFHRFNGNPQSLCGRKLEEISEPGYAEYIKTRLTAVYETGTRMTGETRTLIRGRMAWLRFSLEPIREKNGFVDKVMLVERDITAQKDLETKLLRVQRLESLGTLAGGIAHDLNNVLSPILTSVACLRRALPSTEDKTMLDLIACSAKRGASIIRQLLTFGRGTSGEFEVVQMRHLLKEMEHIARETFPKNISFTLECVSNLWMVKGDPTQLHQLLLNLCVNARDAMPSGGKILIRGRNTQFDQSYAQMNPEAKPGPYIELIVSDTGVGMEPDIQDKIFEPFFTTKPVGQGSGLGLSTALGIARSHGGFIHVDSRIHEGTKFMVYLPAAEAGVVAEIASETEPAPAQGHGELVLVVDDEDTVRAVVSRVLKESGYQVIAAADGIEALATFTTQNKEIDLVLMDMVMPLMDGGSAIRALRKINPAVPIIAASGILVRQKQDEAAKAGVQRFLTKPFTAEVLLSAIDEQLHPEAVDRS